MIGLPRHRAVARGRVAIPYALPDWIASILNDRFEFVPTDGDAGDLADVAVLLTSGTQDVSRATLSRLPGLQYICCIGSGYEGVDVAFAVANGMTVSNSAIVTAEDVADQLVALTLASCCEIVGLDQAVREGRWLKPVRRSLRERRIGIFGLGAIGEATARRLTAFGPDIRWTGPRPKPSPFSYVADLLDLAEWSDVLLVAARADRSNAGLIGEAVFDRLGPEGLIVNVSRGTILDEEALIAALRAGRLGGAALDVFQTEPTPASRWHDVPNVVLSPHVGGYASGVRRGIQQLVGDNLDAFFAGRPVKGIVSVAAG